MGNVTLDDRVKAALERLEVRIAERDPERYAEEVHREMTLHYERAAEFTAREGDGG